MSSLYSTIFGLMLRAKANLKGNGKYYLYDALKKEQYLPEEKLKKIQLERLNKLILHAANNSSFYKERLAEKKITSHGLASLEELSEIQVLTREDIQTNKKDILSPIDETYYSDSSGGSTGVPVNFFHDSYYKLFGEALHLLFLSWMGISEGDKTIVFWGADRDFSELTFKEKLYQVLERVRLLNSFDIDNKTIDRFLMESEKFDPQYIFGYATSLAQAADKILEKGKYKFSPKAIRSSAEMLYPEQKTKIEKAFNSKVFNFYGSREVNNLAAECSEQNGLHVFASGRIIEVVDNSNRLVPDGEVGHLLVTDLTNLSFPFIRYKIGDMGSIKSEKCKCRINYPLLGKISGRSSDILEFGGKHIHGEFFTHLFYERTDVKQFQVIQNSQTSLTVKIKTDNKELDLSPIIIPIKEKIGDEVEIDIQLVDKIDSLKSGKYRFTINNSL